MSDALIGVTPYGILKPIRYMVNSTAEFLEVIYTVNHILGVVHEKSVLETLQREARFDVLPLPHSQSKFIACFEVPSELLGLPTPRKPQLLNYGEDSTARKPATLHRNPPRVLMQFAVNNLYDINLALYDFEAALAPAVPAAQFTRVKRSIQVMFQPRQTREAAATMIISAEANLATAPVSSPLPQQPS